VTVFRHLRHRGLDAAGDLESRSIAVFENTQQGCCEARPAGQYSVGASIHPALGLPCADADNGAIYGFDWQIVQPLDQWRLVLRSMGYSFVPILALPLG